MNIKEIYNKNEPINFNNYLEKCGVKDIQEFISPSGKYIDDYKLYKDIPYAIKELEYWIEFDDTKIVLIQDGDGDGVCSCVMMYDYLYKLNPNWDIRVLLHTKKQRGLDDEQVMNDIRKIMPTLVIVTDAGTNNVIESEELCELNIGLIVLDHHDYQTPIQKGILINNQNPNYNVQRNGSGALVTHKFLQALDEHFGFNYSVNMIDLVALSLVSDSCDMSELENRTYYHYGLETIDKINNEFLKAMINEFIGNKSYTQRDISFKIVPKINSICRHYNQEYKQQLFLAFLGMADTKETLELCKNTHTEQIETVTSIIENNQEEIEKLKENNLIVFSSDDIPRSYSGLVCGKVMNLCDGKPSIVGKEKDGMFVGSLRSPIPLREQLDNNELVAWANGHEDSCGICIPSENLKPLVDYYNTLNLSYEPCKQVLKSFTPLSIQKTLFKAFEGYDELWGKNIPKPLYHIKLSYQPQDIKVMGKGQTTLKITQNGIDFVFFFVSAEKKEQLGLELQIDEIVENGYEEPITQIVKTWVAKDHKKRTLDIICSLGLNIYVSKNGKTYINNQGIVEEFEVSDYKPKAIEDIF